MRPPAATVLCAIAMFVSSATAVADDGWGFRLTTPRGDMTEVDDDLLIAIPYGRAWGITGGLVRLPDPGSSVSAEIAVTDERVREAFLRVAYYERGAGRPRQMDIADSASVQAGASARVTVALDPPLGARWYRVRVLGRLVPGAVVSSRGAIVVGDVGVSDPDAASAAMRVRRTRFVEP